MDIQLPQIIFQLINFSVVVGALSYLLYKPVQKIFEERASRIEAGLKAAEENLAQQNKIKDYQSKVKKEAEKQATDILDEARQKAEQRRKQILAEAKQEADAVLQKQMKEWETEKKQLLVSMRQELVDSVIAVSQKVIGKSLDKKEQTALIDQEIDSIVKAL
jgi:F-type H+-transporting ATPase subunit b